MTPDAIPPATSRTPLAEAHRNCIGHYRAEGFGVVIDGDEYMRAVKAALLAARRQVLLLGWDFDSRIKLDRRDPDDIPIGRLLERQVRANPDLHVHLLIWDSPILYSFDREPLASLKLGVLSDPRITLQFDRHHPKAAAHHQKVIVVDDKVAFIGGMDITSARWDSRDHLPLDPLRADFDEGICPPVHDLQAVVDGAAARALGELARERWRLATGHALERPRQEPEGAASGPDPWPEWLTPALRRVPVTIARTMPPWQEQPECRESEQLFLDMIAAAERFIYLECQYLASWRIGNALAARLDEPDGPEIIVVTCKESVALLEEIVMGASRARLLLRLKACDRHGRLHLFWPRNSDGSEIKVHAKVSIVDDRLLRIGSSNLNNRSMGLDTEVDALVEANDPASMAAIRRLRQDLMAEHLGIDVAVLAACEATRASIAATIAALVTDGRSLAPLPEPREHDLLPGGEILDLDTPLESSVHAETLPAPMPVFSRTFPRFGLTVGLLAVFAATWGLLPPGAWSGTWHQVQPYLAGLEEWQWHPLGLGVTILLFVLGGLVAAPVTMLILVTAMIFGPWGGMLHAFAGCLASASVLYLLGGRFGRDTLSRLAGRRLSQINRSLARHGIMAMAILRLVPIAPFTIINLVAGASLIRFRTYIAGTALGMAPGIIMASVFGDRIGAVLRSPDMVNIGILAGVALVMIGLGFLLARYLVRQRRTTLKPQEAGSA